VQRRYCNEAEGELRIPSFLRLSSFLAAITGLGAGTTGSWPALPHSGFISGRAATVADIDAGNAVFVAAVNNVVIGKPIAIPIPQYVYLTGAQGGMIPAILVQAEEARGKQLCGVRDFSGQEHVVTLPELRLLGKTPPASK